MKKPIKLVLLTCACAVADVVAGTVVFTDRSYYTTEENAWLLWPSAAGVDSARVVDASGKQLATTTSGDSRITVALRDLPVGVHELNVELHAAGKPLTRGTVELIKRAPKPGHEWKVDRLNHVLLREGAPHFPYGLVMYGIAAPRDAAAFEEVARLGMNTVIRWYWCDPEQAVDYHVMAAKHALHVIEPVDRFSADNLTSAKLSPNFDDLFAKNLPRISSGIGNVKTQPSLMTWYNFDEPLKGQVASGRRLYAKTRELDGYHPTMTLYSSSIPPGDEYLDWCDIVAVDPYWTPAGSGVRGNVNYVSKNVALSRQRADAAGKVLWVVPMAELYSGIRKRPLLPQEQFCQSYLALIHGARGLVYFRYPMMHQKSVDALEALGKEMKTLGSIALTPEIAQTLDYSPASFDPARDEFPDVQVSLRRRPSGGFVLLAANTRPYPVDATFHLPMLSDGSKITHLFRSGSLAVNSAAFTEQIEALGTRAYVMPEVRDVKTPAQIAVRTQSHPDKADADYGPGVPDSGRPGKRNLLANPGFEAASFPEWPDYYLFSPERVRLGQKGARLFGLDGAQPFEGKQCLWMQADGSASEVKFYTACSPQLTEPKPYVLSAWMRADRDGVKVRFVGFGWRVPQPTFGAQEFTLTTKWQRCFERGTLPPKLPDWHSVGVEIAGKQQAKVWIDAVQFEAGTEPTAYEP
ncbi:MAG: hypothetical protein ACKODH_08900 [Limisphaerales bacterium]